MATDRIRQFDLFNKYLEPDETPLITSLDGPPKPYYYYPTHTVMVQPYHRHWTKLYSILQDIRDDRCPGDEWEEECDWTPSAEYLDLQDLARELKKIAFQEEPNPSYDFHRAKEWDRMHPGRGPMNQNKVEWGQAYVIHDEDTGKFDEGTTAESQEDE